MSSDSARERAAIVIVSRDAIVQKSLSEELSGRYAVDYQIVACDEPAELDSRIRELLRTGTPVALVIGGAGEADPDGIEVLAQVRLIDPTVPRVATIRWGEWDTARPIFDAITTGKIEANRLCTLKIWRAETACIRRNYGEPGSVIPLARWQACALALCPGPEPQGAEEVIRRQSLQGQ